MVSSVSTDLKGESINTTEHTMKQLEDLSVSNIFLYVADAVRWDSLPEGLSERGLTIKTISSSIHTPTSFPSIATGLHPPQHGIWDFSYRLDKGTLNLLNLNDYSTAFANSMDEKFVDEPPQEFVLDKILNTPISSMNELETIDPPFIFMERGRGGHSPYGDYPGNGWEYYRERGAAPTSKYRADYQEGIELDVSHFESQVNVLAERGLLEDTLIIYTSDHGELLGEGGCLGHNEPIHPKHVNIPTVMIHPSIENKNIDDLLRHVDFFPTIISLLDEEISELPGRDLTSQELATYGTSFYKRSMGSNMPVSAELDYESVWDSTGGYVFPKTSRVDRTFVLGGKLLKASKREYMRQHLPSVIRFYLSGDTVYGEPSMSQAKAIDYLSKINDLPKSTSEHMELNDEAKDHLRELGYLE